jgi:anti-anti-sigma factor
MTDSPGRGSTLHIDYSQAATPADGDVTVMTVRGHLDIDSSPQLRSALEGLLSTDVRRLVLDLGGLGFCDSVGLSALVDAHRAVQARGGFVRLAAPSPFLTRVLGVVGLFGRLAIYDTLAGALADEPPGGRPLPPADVPGR